MKAWIKQNRSLLLRWTGTILSLALLIVVFYTNREDLATALGTASQHLTLTGLLVSFGLIFLSRLMTVARWYVLLRSGGIRISFKDTALLTFTGLFASNFLPTSVGGDIVRLAGAMQLGYDRAICLASIAADRLVNMTGMSMAAPLGIYQLLQVGPLQSLALAGLWEKGWGFMRRTLASLTIWLRQPLSLLGALLFTLGNLFCIAISYYLLISAMGEDLSFWKLVGLVSTGYFLGLMPFTINGYGWHETIMSTLFWRIGGLNYGVAAVVVILQRVLMMLASLPGAISAPAVLAKMGQEQDASVDGQNAG